MHIYKKISAFWNKHPLIMTSLFFLGLSFLFTWPLGLHFGSQIPEGGGDTFQAISNIDSHTKALSGVGFFAGAKIFLSKLGTYSPFVLLNLLVNKYAAYNTMFFLSYILSGLGAYLLAYHFTKRTGASLVAGVLFAFAPFHYYQTVAVHLGSMQQQWIPFAALFLIKFLDEVRFKDFVLFSFFLFMLAISEHQLLAFSLLFFLTLISIKIWQNRELIRNKKLWIYLASALFIFGIIVFFVFGDLIKVATSPDNFLDPGSGAAKKYAMNAWEPLIPPSFHAFWPGINEWLRKSVGIAADWRDSYFVSFSVLILLGIFAWSMLRKKNKLVLEKSDRKSFKLWLMTFLVLYVFSWGPGFKIFNLDLPLPYYLVYKFLPFYENIRVTGRIFMFALLALSILVAFAVKYLQPKIKTNFFRRWLAPLLVVLIMLEFWVAPIKTMSLAYSPFYDTIAQQQGAFKILEIPGSTDYEFASYKLFTNNIHGKQSVDGMALARKTDGQFDFQQSTPVIKQLLYTLPKGNDPEQKEVEDILRANNFQNATDILNYYGIRYITVSKKYSDANERKNIDEFIKKYILIDNFYEDKFLVAYSIENRQSNGYYVRLNTDNGQFSLSNSPKGEEYFSRKLGSGAEVEVVNMGKEPKSLTIGVAAKSPEKYVLKVLLPDGTTQEMPLLNDFGEKSWSFATAPGSNKLRFLLLDQSGKEVFLNEKGKGGAEIKEISIK